MTEKPAFQRVLLKLSGEALMGDLEYGTDSLQIHRDAIGNGARVIVLDDVLATGGTAKAKCELVEQLGGEVVGALFLIELTFLSGREALRGIHVESVLTY